jgi:hypothetical protein
LSFQKEVLRKQDLLNSNFCVSKVSKSHEKMLEKVEKAIFHAVTWGYISGKLVG